MVKWKDVLTGLWKGPDPILIRSRGAVCVFPQEEDNPFWLPERLTQRILTPENDSRMDPLETTSSPHATSVELGS